MDTRKKVVRTTEQQLRDARRALRMVQKAEWMVTCDWCDPLQRYDMWKQAKKLAGLR
jgi:hypothetical protein